MIFGVDMGHSLSGAGTGAAGIYKEVDKNREVGKRLIAMLKEKGHTVINCTCDSAASTNAQLSAIVAKANAQRLDVFVSLHLNSYDTAAYGVETYIYNGSWAGKESNRAIATKVNDSLAANIGWYNRGVKEANYYVLQATVAPAILVELGFCDSKRDMDLWNTEKIAVTLFESLTNTKYIAAAPTPAPTAKPSTTEDWDNKEVSRYKETGTCYPNTTLNFRDKPSTKTGVVQGQYFKGESVNYDLVVITNRYVFISWVGRTGARRYMAIKDKKTNERWGNCV